MLAFAVGALLGDAFLHLIPHAFGIHDHGHDHDEHDHDDEEESKRLLHAEHEEEGHGHHHVGQTGDNLKSVWVSIAILLGIFFFYCLEKLLHTLGIAHSHGGESDHEHHH